MFGFIVFGVLWPSISFAHQPRLVEGEAQPIKIENPEVSKAYYGNLNDAADEFVIESSYGFNLSVELTVPDVESAKKDFTVNVYRNDLFLFKLEGSNAEWKSFFDEFANDAYLVGPKQQVSVPDGTYKILVDNPSNTGRYVLVVGNREEFPITEALSALRIMPTIKEDFFGKSAWTMLSISYVWVPLAILLVFLILMGMLIRRS